MKQLLEHVQNGKRPQKRSGYGILLHKCYATLDHAGGYYVLSILSSAALFVCYLDHDLLLNQWSRSEAERRLLRTGSANRLEPAAGIVDKVKLRPCCSRLVVMLLSATTDVRHDTQCWIYIAIRPCLLCAPLCFLINKYDKICNNVLRSTVSDFYSGDL
jgi:hypothetical protein